MAVPAKPSVGSRAVYFPAAPPVPPNPNIPVAPGVSPTLLPGAFGTSPAPVQQVDMPIPGAGGLPAIVLRAGTGASPDFSGTILLVFDQNGNIYTRSNVVSTTTWTGLGSPPTVARWALVDALS
jgi:hypothetical protein